MMDALYARQSIDKKDSISVESQLEYCRYEARGNLCREYVDRGYSGKDTKRPGYESMMKDISSGLIGRVIVYKLDRISRSILDFSNMMENFQKYHVEFVSSTEKFDTSTPIGRAMLNICIVFAQLERETIQKRVADAYHSRSRRGLYMGGKVPYGYRLSPVTLNGVASSMFVPVPEECGQLQTIYSLYSRPDCSLNDVVRYLNTHNMEYLREGMWTPSRISAILKNPVYVRADAFVYEYLKSQGAEILSPVCDFAGVYACYQYRGYRQKQCKTGPLSDREIVLAPHEGIVGSEEWLACQRRGVNYLKSTQTCKAVNSWLSGKVKCGNCGYGLKIVKSKTRWHRYFVCSSSAATLGKRCSGTGGTVYARALEDYISLAVRKKLSELGALHPQEAQRGEKDKRNEKKMKLVQIEEKLDQMILKIEEADGPLMSLLNSRARQLEKERGDILKAMEQGAGGKTLENAAALWNRLEFSDKKAVVDLMIDVITISDGRIKIFWNL